MNLVDLVKEHGHQAWMLNEHQICVKSVGDEHVSILAAREEVVMAWLGY